MIGVYIVFAVLVLAFGIMMLVKIKDYQNLDN